MLPMLIEGTPQREIAKKVGVSQGSVSLFLNHPDIKKQVEHGKRELFERTKRLIIDNNVKMINLANNELMREGVTLADIQANKDAFNIIDKKEARISEMSGMSPSRTPHVNIDQSQGKQINQVVFQALSGGLSNTNILPDCEIDAEIIEQSDHNI